LRAAFLVPYLVSGVAAAIMWRFLFTGTTSLINRLIAIVGIESVTWLGDPIKALIVVILANIWFLSPLAILLLLGGLQSIDRQLYDAASIDGASAVQKFLYVTVPSIMPMIALSLVWLSFGSFNMFDIILPLTGGGPGHATEVLAVYMYDLAFDQLNYSDASVVMVVLLIINVVFSAFYLKGFRRG
jgi:ABC-type sugar transport system permease subunit